MTADILRAAADRLDEDGGAVAVVHFDTGGTKDVGKALAAWLRVVTCAFLCDDDGMRSPYCSACSDSTYDHECPDREPCPHSGSYSHALTVAHLILGGRDD